LAGAAIYLASQLHPTEKRGYKEISVVSRMTANTLRQVSASWQGSSLCWWVTISFHFTFLSCLFSFDPKQKQKQNKKSFKVLYDRRMELLPEGYASREAIQALPNV